MTEKPVNVILQRKKKHRENPLIYKICNFSHNKKKLPVLFAQVNYFKAQIYLSIFTNNFNLLIFVC